MHCFAFHLFVDITKLVFTHHTEGQQIQKGSDEENRKLIFFLLLFFWAFPKKKVVCVCSVLCWKSLKVKSRARVNKPGKLLPSGSIRLPSVFSQLPPWQKRKKRGPRLFFSLLLYSSEAGRSYVWWWWWNVVCVVVRHFLLLFSQAIVAVFFNLCFAISSLTFTNNQVSN